MKENNSLQPISESVLLFNKLLEQINKDFQMAGLDIVYLPPLPTSISDCLVRLQEAVREANKNNPGLIKALMYRIDVSERKVIDTLAEPQEETFEERVASVILQREAQKVLLKNTYSK